MPASVAKDASGRHADSAHVDVQAVLPAPGGRWAPFSAGGLIWRMILVKKPVPRGLGVDFLHVIGDRGLFLASSHSVRSMKFWRWSATMPQGSARTDLAWKRTPSRQQAWGKIGDGTLSAGTTPEQGEAGLWITWITGPSCGAHNVPGRSAAQAGNLWRSFPTRRTGIPSNYTLSAHGARRLHADPLGNQSNSGKSRWLRR